jgi:glycosyltransferase involved in cell wall biosynthesis
VKIAVDAACLANERGYGRFARELLHAMVAQSPHDEFVFFADRRAAALVNLPTVRVVVVEQTVSPTLAAAADGSRSLRDMLRFSRAVWRERADVFFSPSVYTYFPLPPTLPAVITIHDAIGDRFPELTLPAWRARLFWRIKTQMALRQASIVLTVSDFASRELQEVYGIAPERIRVAVEAPAAAYRPSDSPAHIATAAARAGIPEGAEWFVYVGGFNPHKHLDVIVRAHAELARSRATPPHLVLVGTVDSDVFYGTRAALLAEIDRAGTASLVHWPGFVADDELRDLHSGAIALLMPSENEGFGLPGVEAAACGTPVIATLASPLPELLEGGGFFVAPRDERGLVHAMRALLDDPSLRARMGTIARERAAQLSWTTAAQATLGALRDAVA